MSYTLNTTLAPDVNSNSTIRAWAGALSGALVSAGWTITSDTGQTLPTALTSNPGSYTSSGFQMFAMADSLQGTAPIFLKLEYGEGNNSGYPMIWVTLGTGTNGAGTLTGKVSTRFPMAPSSHSTNLYNCYFSGDTNRFGAAMWSDPGFQAGADCIVFSVERTKNTSGADTNAGVILYLYTQDTNSVVTNHADTNIAAYQVLLFDSTPAVTNSPWSVPVTPQGSLLNSTDSTVGVAFPTPYGYQPYFPGMGVLCYFGGDFSPYATVSVPGVYGASHTYLALSQTSQVAARAYNGASPSNCHILMRYE